MKALRSDNLRGDERKNFSLFLRRLPSRAHRKIREDTPANKLWRGSPGCDSNDRNLELVSRRFNRETIPASRSMFILFSPDVARTFPTGSCPQYSSDFADVKLEGEKLPGEFTRARPRPTHAEHCAELARARLLKFMRLFYCVISEPGTRSRRQTNFGAHEVATLPKRITRAKYLGAVSS